MDNIETLRAFFGWSAVVNLAILISSSIMLIIMRGKITKIHSKIFGISESNLSQSYFKYLANYKIAIFVTSLGPYIALRIML